MKRNLLLLVCGIALGTSTARAQSTITLWNFNGPANDAVPGGTASPSPAVGSGTASLIGGVTSPTTFSSGTSNGGSTDPVTTTPANYAWQTTTYPAANAANLSAGVQFAVSTVGYSGIQISYDVRHSNTSSRYERVQYSLDGINFTDSTSFAGNAGDTWFNNRFVDLSGIAGANNNPNFAFRIVAEWQSTTPGSGAAAYVASNTSSTYAASGTWRFDMVKVTSVPEPSTLALFGLGWAGLFLRRRRA